MCCALSIIESKYIVTTEGSKEMLWMKWFLKELGQTQEKYVVQCDNQSFIHLIKIPSFHSKSKNIESDIIR